MTAAAIRREGTLRFLQMLKIEDCTLEEVAMALRAARRGKELDALQLADLLTPAAAPVARKRAARR